ncbi:alkaline phosphatase D family protein [Woodsholea maritima]|uniref:alkaline phosphatase D family protein n=1 Tax=Woodsholea maritima TaxID=240237 RepID=UPI00036387EB|nr:alkaline phosphatase D family protein [Woodsholea maritima]
MSLADITRRGALMGAAGLSLAACGQRHYDPIPEAEGPFKHGVASGDPDQTSFVVWTAVTAPAQSVILEVAEDLNFNEIILTEPVEGLGRGVDNAFPHKTLVTGLQPGLTYFYRFKMGDAISPIGQAKTLPQGRVDQFQIHAFSCANYPAGFFNAYRASADAGDADLVLHLGDYLYEYGMGSYATDNAERYHRVPDPTHELLVYEDYARRHAQYSKDPDLQAAKAATSWILIWDDHETANNAFAHGAENHNEGEGEWEVRRDQALRAYQDWLPVREADPAYARYGAVQIGDLATLIYLETRLAARSEEIRMEDIPVSPDTDPNDPEARALVDNWLTQVVGDPSREILGQAQLDYVGQALRTSVEAGQPWRIFANQVLMGSITCPNYITQTPAWLKFVLSRKGGMVWDFARLTQFDVPMMLDAWDGFPAERARLFAMAKEAGADFITLTGDTHNFWALDLKDQDGWRVGSEFGVTSVTSPSDFEFVTAPGVDFAQMAIDANEGRVVHNNVYAKGFIRLTLTPEAADVEMVEVSRIDQRDFTVKTESRWRVNRAIDGVAQPAVRMG